MGLNEWVWLGLKCTTVGAAGALGGPAIGAAASLAFNFISFTSNVYKKETVSAAVDAALVCVDIATLRKVTTITSRAYTVAFDVTAPIVKHSVKQKTKNIGKRTGKLIARKRTDVTGRMEKHVIIYEAKCEAQKARQKVMQDANEAVMRAHYIVVRQYFTSSYTDAVKEATKSCLSSMTSLCLTTSCLDAIETGATELVKTVIELLWFKTSLMDDITESCHIFDAARNAVDVSISDATATFCFKILINSSYIVNSIGYGVSRMLEKD